MRSTFLILLAAGIAASLPAGAIAGESGNEARLRDALRSTVAQLRAAEEERSKGQAHEAELQSQIDALKKQLAAAPKQPRAGERSAGELVRCQAEKADGLAKAAQALQQCQAASADAAHGAEAKETERAALAAELTALKERAGACEEKNGRMFQISKELIDRISNGGGGEPIFGLKRVELENLAQDYEDKLLEQKVKP